MDHVQYAGNITILRPKALNPAMIVSQNGALYSLAGHMGEWCSFQVFTHYFSKKFSFYNKININIYCFKHQLS